MVGCESLSGHSNAGAVRFSVCGRRRRSARVRGEAQAFRNKTHPSKYWSGLLPMPQYIRAHSANRSNRSRSTDRALSLSLRIASVPLRHVCAIVFIVSAASQVSLSEQEYSFPSLHHL